MLNVAINDNGDLITREKLPATTEALDQYFEAFDEPAEAVVESTSNWYWLADWCASKQIPLKLAHAKMCKAISYAKVKTDKVDAHTLAELLRVGLVPEAHKVMGERRALRELTRGRLRMVQRRDRLQTSVWNLAAKYNVEVGTIGWQYPDQLLEGLCPQLPSAVHMELSCLIRQVVQLQGHIRQMEQSIDSQQGFLSELELLTPIPGVGRVVGWTILAEIGDITRFPTPKKFVSYCRLVPGSADSNNKKRHSPGKDGNRYLRLAFGQAAVVAYSRYRVVKQFYKKIAARSGRPVGRTVVAKELAKIVWHVLTKEEPYKGFKGRPTRAVRQPGWPQPISPRVRLADVRP
jgi:transposase